MHDLVVAVGKIIRGARVSSIAMKFMPSAMNPIMHDVA
jgi:hypothetical protein